jgi:hypothetical protein
MAIGKRGIIAVVVVGVVALGAGIVVGQNMVGSDDGGGDGLVEHRVESAGFAISYPEKWKRLEAKDRDVVLLASELELDDQAGGSILARVSDLGIEVGPGQIAEARKVTDALVAEVEGVELQAEPTQIEQGGLPGYLYSYTFLDPVSGERGAHSHYFLFKDKTMLSLVFQAIPQDDFVRLADVFDQVAGSLHVIDKGK